jgi:hypothetical protein
MDDVVRSLVQDNELSKANTDVRRSPRSGGTITPPFTCNKWPCSPERFACRPLRIEPSVNDDYPAHNIDRVQNCPFQLIRRSHDSHFRTMPVVFPWLPITSGATIPIQLLEDKQTNTAIFILPCACRYQYKTNHLALLVSLPDQA